MPATKVATCNYCGTRAALVLTGRERHELACASCGAPLHDLKMLPKAKAQVETPRGPYVAYDDKRRKPSKKYKKKKKKSIKSRFWDEAKDLLDDIFD